MAAGAQWRVFVVAGAVVAWRRFVAVGASLGLVRWGKRGPGCVAAGPRIGATRR